MLKVLVSVLLATFINLLLFYGILRLVTPQPAEPDQMIPVQVVEFVEFLQEAKQPQRVRRRQLPTPPELPQHPPEPPRTIQATPNRAAIPTPVSPMPETGLSQGLTQSPVVGKPKPLATPKSKIPADPKPEAPTPAIPLREAPAATTPATVKSVPPVSTPPIGTTRDPTPIYRVKPAYPKRALRFGIEGMVRVEFTITETGSVESPTIITATPPKIFDNAVLRAVLHWRFEPYSVAGRATRRRAMQDVHFSLKER